MKKILIFLCTLMICDLWSCSKDTTEDEKSSTPQKPTTSPTEELTDTLSALEFLQSAKIGWNLGNQMDSHNNGVSNETAWGNVKITQRFIDSVARAGFGFVRIPVTWMGHIGSKSTNYKIEDAWLNRVSEIVGYVKNAHMKALVNIHHDGSESKYWLNIKNAATSTTKHTEINNELYQIWYQIATHFKNEGQYLAFESMNEIQDGDWGWGGNRTDDGLQYAILNEWNQTFVDAVRAAGGENDSRFLGICGYSANPSLTMEYLKLPTDPASDKLMVAVHYYDPYTYAINADFQQWGHNAEAGKTESYGQELDIVNTYKKLKSTYIDKNIPVYIGEYGAVRQEGYEAFRNYYMEYVTKAAHDNGLVPFYWDNGVKGSGKECFGIFDRSNGEYQKQCGEMLTLMMKAAGVIENDNSYTLDFIYNKSYE